MYIYIYRERERCLSFFVHTGGDFVVEKTLDFLDCSEPGSPVGQLHGPRRARFFHVLSCIFQEENDPLESIFRRLSCRPAPWPPRSAAAATTAGSGTPRSASRRPSQPAAPSRSGPRPRSRGAPAGSASAIIVISMFTVTIAITTTVTIIYTITIHTFVEIIYAGSAWAPPGRRPSGRRPRPRTA